MLQNVSKSNSLLIPSFNLQGKESAASQFSGTSSSYVPRHDENRKALSNNGVLSGWLIDKAFSLASDIVNSLIPAITAEISKQSASVKSNSTDYIANGFFDFLDWALDDDDDDEDDYWYNFF